ncbi:MAG: proton-conducting transporter membrane subunit [Thermofilaceae archaeon]
MGPQEILAIYFLVALLTVIFNRIEERIRRYNIMGIFTVLGLGVVLVALPFLQEGVYKPLSSSELPPSEFKVDTLSRTLALIFTAIGLSAALYSLPYIREERRAAYYTLYLLLMAGLTGALFSNDLFTFFCFWELAAASAYSLVGYRWWYWEPVEAAFKYLVACTLGALTTLYATAMIYGLCGTTNLDEISVIIGTNQPPRLVVASASLLFIVGLGTTAAIVPFHMWLPDAHAAAPSPVSSMLSGVIVNIPLVMLAKILFNVMPRLSELGYVLITLGAISGLVGSAAALAQLDVKRLLAYSTIANLGYVMLGLGTSYRASVLGSQELALVAATGAFIQMVAHALSKSLLFMSVGYAIEATGSRHLASLEGFGRSMPLTGASSLVALANLLGIPPMVSYYGKTFIIAGLAYKLSDPAIMVALAVYMVSYAIAIGVYAYLAFRIFRKRAPSLHEAPLPMLAAELSIAAGILALSIYPSPLIEGVQAAVRRIIG